jgi:hypothetical protein
MNDTNSSDGIGAAWSEAMNKLCRWRSVFVGWMIGSKHADEPGVKAYRDAVDARLSARVDINALTTLLIEKRVFTREEFMAQATIEARLLDAEMESFFPGYKTTDIGVSIDTLVAQQTNARLGFPL